MAGSGLGETEIDQVQVQKLIFLVCVARTVLIHRILFVASAALDACDSSCPVFWFEKVDGGLDERSCLHVKDRDGAVGELMKRPIAERPRVIAWFRREGAESVDAVDAGPLTRVEYVEERAEGTWFGGGIW